ncbi:hypothetical protein LCGC14_2447880 [marine sediment metagenome]|uniref:Uncharacterized protein n=1 Tax=marine sediment metagenome TaxID=412755 RepID=A0A0F9C4L9_9ZZZZ
MKTEETIGDRIKREGDKVTLSTQELKVLMDNKFYRNFYELIPRRQRWMWFLGGISIGILIGERVGKGNKHGV